MSTVGLTEDQRTTLALISGHGEAVVVHPRVYAALARKGLVVGRDVTPRGHAALAAPRMTQAELETLENCEADLYVTIRMPSGHEWRTLGRFRNAGLVSPLGFSLTPAGRTALNNVRAAMGSPDWKEGL
jgi:hypothetical protein